MIFFGYYWVSKNCFGQYDCNFDDIAKLAILDLFKISLFWNKVYNVIINAYGVINKIFSTDTIYIVNAVMWPKYGNSDISMKEVIIALILHKLDQKSKIILISGIDSSTMIWDRLEVWSWKLKARHQKS